MEYQHITYELRNQTAWIHLNRPADMNAISADEMMAYGLVNQVVADDALEESVQKLADKLSQKSGLVLSRMKRVANESLDLPQDVALRNELLTLRDHLRSYDMHEGIAAFREKRKPEFKDR